MTIWPSEYEDTVNYRSREFVSADDVTVRMIDENILSIWGDVWYNGKRLASSSWTDLSSFGAKYDGSDESIILQEAVDELPAYSHLHISGPLALGTPVVCKETLTITGEGWASPISPHASFSGGFLLELRYTAGSVGQSFSHLSGIVLDNLVFNGKLRSVRCSGLKLNLVQESFFSRLRFWNLNGYGLQCYNSVRDSIFNTIMVRHCANYDMHEAAVDITNYTGNVQDGHNNLAFYGLWSHINDGDALAIGSETDTSPARIFMFLGCKFHGVWQPGETGSDGVPYTHMSSGRVIVRNARGIEFTNCRFHANGPGFPLLHLGPHPLQPGTSSSGFGLAQCNVGNGAAPMTATVTGAANNELKFGAAHYYSTGMMVRSTASTVSGVSLATDYFVIRVDTSTIKLASTYANAEAGVAMTTGSSGSVSLTTQECRIFIEENTSGVVNLRPGFIEDGTSPRPSIVNKASQQLVVPYAGSQYLDADTYEGPITQNDLFNHLEVDGDLNHDGTKAGFFGITPVVQPTGVSAGEALVALGLGINISSGGGTHFAEQPPLSRSPGTQWYVPSLAHMAIWSGTAWVPLTPTAADANICCVIGNFNFLIDATAWSGVSLSNFTNYGTTSVVTATPSAGVTQATDGSSRKYAAFNGSSSDISMSANAIWDMAIGDSFSLFVVKNQSVYTANSTIFGCRQNAGSSTEVGWALMSSATDGTQKFRIVDGTILNDATSGTTAAGELRLYLGVRDVAADNIKLFGTAVEPTTTDTTTASLVSVNPPRIGRSGGSGTQRATIDLYMAGLRRKALTATEITTFKSWVTARFS